MKKIIPITLCALVSACGGTSVVDLNNEQEVSNMQQVMELEYRDWTNTAENMTKSLIASGALDKTQKPIIAMGDMINDTTQRFDTDVLTKKIRTTLLKSGKAQISTNFNGEDTNSNKVRTLRDNKEYAQDTIATTGTLIAPNMSLSGKMLQRNLKLESGWFSSVDTRVEYYLQMTLTDLKSGLSVWEDEQPIIKEGTHTPTW
nr:penicillin-binding protein activator LpoB [Candidatus Enterousia merdequi]